MIAFRGGSENKALSRISEALGPGVTGYHCTRVFWRSWSLNRLLAAITMAELSSSSSPLSASAAASDYESLGPIFDYFFSSETASPTSI